MLRGSRKGHQAQTLKEPDRIHGDDLRADAPSQRQSANFAHWERRCRGFSTLHSPDNLQKFTPRSTSKIRDGSSAVDFGFVRHRCSVGGGSDPALPEQAGHDDS